MTTSSNSGVPLARACHQLVSAAACVDHRASIAIIAVQALVTLHAGHPYNHVISSISGCDPGRTPTGLTHAPREGYGGRVCWGNLVGPDEVGLVMKREICSLVGVVRDSRRTSVSARDISLRHR